MAKHSTTRTRRKTKREQTLRPASLVMAMVFAVFALFMPFPVLWLWSRVAPTEVVAVQIEDRRAQESFAYTGRSAQSGESYTIVLRRDDGSTKRVDVDQALYRRATGAFDALNALGLEQTRALNVPVTLLVLPDGTQVRGETEDAGALVATARERFDLRPNTVLALGALALNGLLLSLLFRPMVVRKDRRIFLGASVVGFVLGMIWMVG